MLKPREILPAFVQRWFWPFLASSLLLLVAGGFLWYSVDTSEVYFKNYVFESVGKASTQRWNLPKLVQSGRTTAVQADKPPSYADTSGGCRKVTLPLWQFDLAAGDTVRISLQLPDVVPDGQWFIEVLGHPIGSSSEGSIRLNGHPMEVTASAGPRWQRIYLDAPPVAAGDSFTLRYDGPEAGAKFRVWGTYGKASPRPRTASVLVERPRSSSGRHDSGLPKGRPTLAPEAREWVLLVPEPPPFRRSNLAPDHELQWRTAYTSCSVDPFFRVGVRTQLISPKWIADKMIIIAGGLLIGLLLVFFAAFAIAHPASGLAVFVISLAAFWLRWSAIGSLADQYERTVGGLTVRHQLWADSAQHFWLALRIFSNETPASLLIPIGMSSFSSYLFQWNGIDHVPTKYGFALFHTLVGPALFFACRGVVRFKLLAFLPLLIWSGFLRPIKYSYYYLTESLAMCLLIAWIAMLISRDPRAENPGPNWPWMVISASIVFVLSSYSRDIIITFLPVFLGMIWIFAGGRLNHRLTSAASALVIVVTLWCASPLLFANKSFSLDPIEFLAITPRHYRTAGLDVVSGEGHTREARRQLRKLAAADGVSVFAMLEKSLGELADRPGAYLAKAYSGAKNIWGPHYRWTQIPDYKTGASVFKQRKREMRSPSLYSLGEPNVRTAYESSAPARYLLGDNPGGNYARLLMLTAVTAVFGLIFSPRWRVLACLLLYATLFQVVLFQDFSARPRAIFFPVIVLLASLGVFATLEQFSVWLRAVVIPR